MSEMYNNDFRTSYFKKDASLESVLKELNEVISPIQSQHTTEEVGPIVLLMGCPRAGSTAMLQWLASTGAFSYPTNLIARFYKNPYVGIRVQQALLDYDPINQIGFDLNQNDIKSELGKTLGAVQPSEYWYFWREFFKFHPDSSVLDEKAIAHVDGDSFMNHLKQFEALTGRPLVLKGMLLNYHIKELFGYYPKFIFVNLERDPFYNAQSLLFAREKYFDDRSKWYSFKPPEYNELKALDPIAQVAGQVVYMQQVVRNSLADLPEQHVLNITYSEFCADPNAFLTRLKHKFNQMGAKLQLPAESFDHKHLVSKNSIRLPEEEAVALKEQIARFQSISKS